MAVMLLACAPPQPAAAPPAPPPAATQASAATDQAAPDPPKAEALRLASTRWSPFTDDADHARVAVDLVHTALSRAGYAATTTIVTGQTLTEQLDKGAFDGSVAMWKSPEREEFLLFSDAYLENRLVLVGLKGSDVSATSFKNLKGKRIGIVEGYAYGPALESATEPLFVKGPSTELNLRALLDRKVDYVLADALLMAHVFQRYPRQANERLVVAAKPLITRTLHFVVRKDVPNAERIIERFNEEIHLMLADGSYNQALGLAWVSVDVDGDGRPELVPRAGKVGSAPPQGTYSVSSPVQGGQPPEAQGYYIGGRHYENWDVVPEDRKGAPPNDAFLKQFTFKALKW